MFWLMNSLVTYESYFNNNFNFLDDFVMIRKRWFRKSPKLS